MPFFINFTFTNISDSMDNNDKKDKISIVKRIHHNMTFFVDENNLIKGEWGGFYLVKDELGDKIYNLYHIKFKRYTFISENGDFCYRFSCKRYDSVCPVYDDCYICEKNGRYGIIKEDESTGDEIVLLDVCYKDIRILKNNEFICESEVGFFLFNCCTLERSQIYDEIIINDHNYNECPVVRDNEKYGCIDHHGNLLVRAICKDYDFSSGTTLLYKHRNKLANVEIRKGMFFGVIDPQKYYICFPLDGTQRSYYIAQYESFDWGVLNFKGDYVLLPIYNEIINESFDILLSKDGRCITNPCVICRSEDRYKLFNLVTKEFIIENDCSSISFKELKIFNECYKCIEYIIKGKKGYITNRLFNVSPDDYDSIEIIADCFVVSKNQKFGVLNDFGTSLLPCEYDVVSNISGRNIEAIKDGISYNIERHDLVPPKEKPFFYEQKHYNRFGGYQGYSDEDIDTIFDGDPSAYWNID